MLCFSYSVGAILTKKNSNEIRTIPVNWEKIKQMATVSYSLRPKKCDKCRQPDAKKKANCKSCQSVKRVVLLVLRYDRTNIRIPTEIKATAKEWDKKPKTIDKHLNLNYLRGTIEESAARKEARTKLINWQQRSLKMLQQSLEHGNNDRSFLKKQAECIVQDLDPAKEVEFWEFFDIIANNEKLKPSTRKSYQTTRNRLKDFEAATGRLLVFDRFDASFYRRFWEWMASTRTVTRIVEGKKIKKTVAPSQAGTRGKAIKNLKSVLKQATKEGLNADRYFEFFKRERGPADDFALNADELKLITEVELPDYLDRSRDRFLILAWTGLSFVDYKQFTPSNIEGGILYVGRTKTNDKCKCAVPLNKEILRIQKKYKHNLTKAPQPISLQALNRDLKMIARRAGITEIVTLEKEGEQGKKYKVQHEKCDLFSSKWARSTFNTMCVRAGIAPQLIMKMTGHKSEAMLRLYDKMQNSEAAKLLQENNKLFSIG